MAMWEILGIEETTNVLEIKKAYASQIKKHKPESDPEGFQLLRSAYEAALQFARAEPFTFECSKEKSPDTDNENAPPYESHNEDVIHDYSSREEENAVFYLLGMLLDDQEERALSSFKEMDKNGLLDNLEWSREFQELIAIRLTDKAARFPYFTTYLIDYFQWQNHQEMNRETVFGIALRTLISQTSFYRFLEAFKAKSLIKNKTQAKEIGVDWNVCLGTKILLSKKNPYFIALQLFFLRKKRKAIATLLKEIHSFRSLPLTSDMEKSILSWWINYGNSRFHLIRFTLFMLFMVAYFFNVSSKHSVTVPEKKQQTVHNIIPSTSTNVTFTLSDYKGKKLDGKISWVLHIPAVKSERANTDIWYISLFDEHYQILNQTLSGTQTFFRNNDGSVDIYLQSKKPEKTDVNWLKTPEADFIVVGGFYWKNNDEIIKNWDGIYIKSAQG